MSAIRSLLAAICASLAAACVANVETDGDQRFPVSSDYPPGTMERINFSAGVAEAWRLSALRTPDRPDADWKIVIITGTPSWSEYWAPTIAGAPTNREVIVADRPGFSLSEPRGAVRDLAAQADALAPMLETRPGQRVLLVGQSFGAPVATLMAQRHPEQVAAVLLVSSFFGEKGATARRLFGVGRIVRPVLPRDLRNSITEVLAQDAQLPAVFAALSGLSQPVVFVHGDTDTFVPLTSAQRISAQHNRTLVEVPGGDHFLNACCVPALLAAMETAIAEAEAQAGDTPQGAPPAHALP
jgi:pimeloyl-ACP methyl ester carboxylesterase